MNKMLIISNKVSTTQFTEGVNGWLKESAIGAAFLSVDIVTCRVLSSWQLGSNDDRFLFL
jgi:hypothetical protein